MKELEQAVRSLARGAAKEETRIVIDRLQALEGKVHALSNDFQKLFYRVDTPTDYSKEDSSEPRFPRAGLPWSEKEDQDLANEFQHMIKRICGIHRRTPGAIRERIKMNMLVDCIRNDM
jgi:hypothetical protein